MPAFAKRSASTQNADESFDRHVKLFERALSECSTALEKSLKKARSDDGQEASAPRLEELGRSLKALKGEAREVQTREKAARAEISTAYESKTKGVTSAAITVRRSTRTPARHAPPPTDRHAPPAPRSAPFMA